MPTKNISQRKSNINTSREGKSNKGKKWEHMRRKKEDSNEAQREPQVALFRQEGGQRRCEIFCNASESKLRGYLTFSAVFFDAMKRVSAGPSSYSLES